MLDLFFDYNYVYEVDIILLNLSIPLTTIRTNRSLTVVNLGNGSFSEFYWSTNKKTLFPIH